MTKKTKHTTRARTKADHRASTTGGRVISLADVLSGPLATGPRRARHAPASGDDTRSATSAAPPAAGLVAELRATVLQPGHGSCLAEYADDLAGELLELLRLFDAVGAQVVGDFTAEQEAFERVIVGGLRSVNGIREIFMASTAGDAPAAGADVEVTS